MLTSAAMKAGFSGGLVVDYPHSTKAKKHFLVLMVGSAGTLPAAAGIGGGEDEALEEVIILYLEDGSLQVLHTFTAVQQPGFLSLICWKGQHLTARAAADRKELEVFVSYIC